MLEDNKYMEKGREEQGKRGRRVLGREWRQIVIWNLMVRVGPGKKWDVAVIYLWGMREPAKHTSKQKAS